MAQQKQELITSPSDEMDGSTGAMAIYSAEINQQVAAARANKRDNTGAICHDVREMVTKDHNVAQAMFYSIPRDGKQLEGPSVRLAEIFAARWGNLRAGARIISIGNDLVTAQGFAHDLQTNFAFSTEVQRSIKGRTGRRYSADMIRVTCLAAQSIAFREAVFKVIPRVFIDKQWEECRRVAIGKAQSIGQTRELVATSFSKMGISKERIAVAMGVPEFDQISMDHVGTLRGMFTAIADGDLTLDEAFPTVAEPAKVAADVPPKQIGGVQGSELSGPPKGKKPRKKAAPKPVESPMPVGMPVVVGTPIDPEDASEDDAEAMETPLDGVEDAEVTSDIQPEATEEAQEEAFSDEEGEEEEAPADASRERRDEWEQFIENQGAIKPLKERGQLWNTVDTDPSLNPEDRKYLHAVMARRIEQIRSKR